MTTIFAAIIAAIITNFYAPSISITMPTTAAEQTSASRVVYATTPLNVRSQPGTHGDILGFLEEGECAYATPVHGSHWLYVENSKVKGYASGNYLADTVETADMHILDETYLVETGNNSSEPEAVYDEVDDLSWIQNDGSKQGSAGRLYIPETGLEVRLFETDLWEDDAQAVVDRKDSAAIFPFQGATIIADHKHQGFDKIKKVSVGTTAYIKNGDWVEAYTCIAKFNGYNTEDYLLDEDGYDVLGGNPGVLCMYTCNQDWKHVTITLWR